MNEKTKSFLDSDFFFRTMEGYVLADGSVAGQVPFKAAIRIRYFFKKFL